MKKKKKQKKINLFPKGVNPHKLVKAQLMENEIMGRIYQSSGKVVCIYCKKSVNQMVQPWDYYFPSQIFHIGCQNRRIIDNIYQSSGY